MLQANGSLIPFLVRIVQLGNGHLASGCSFGIGVMTVVVYRLAGFTSCINCQAGTFTSVPGKKTCFLELKMLSACS